MVLVCGVCVRVCMCVQSVDGGECGQFARVASHRISSHLINPTDRLSHLRVDGGRVLCALLRQPRVAQHLLDAQPLVGGDLLLFRGVLV